MFIFRKDRNKVGLDPAEENTAELIIAKHRNGPLGTVALKFDPDLACFKAIDMHHSN
jgi:replicative DNA helicase